MSNKPKEITIDVPVSQLDLLANVIANIDDSKNDHEKLQDLINGAHLIIESILGEFAHLVYQPEEAM